MSAWSNGNTVAKLKEMQAKKLAKPVEAEKPADAPAPHKEAPVEKAATPAPAEVQASTKASAKVSAKATPVPAAATPAPAPAPAPAPTPAPVEIPKVKYVTLGSVHLAEDLAALVSEQFVFAGQAPQPKPIEVAPPVEPVPAVPAGPEPPVPVTADGPDMMPAAAPSYPHHHNMQPRGRYHNPQGYYPGQYHHHNNRPPAFGDAPRPYDYNRNMPPQQPNQGYMPYNPNYVQPPMGYNGYQQNYMPYNSRGGYGGGYPQNNYHQGRLQMQPPYYPARDQQQQQPQQQRPPYNQQ